MPMSTSVLPTAHGAWWIPWDGTMSNSVTPRSSSSTMQGHAMMPLSPFLSRQSSSTSVCSPPMYNCMTDNSGLRRTTWLSARWATKTPARRGSSSPSVWFTTRPISSAWSRVPADTPTRCRTANTLSILLSQSPFGRTHLSYLRVTWCTEMVFWTPLRGLLSCT